jgi:hypothetical protein
MRPARALAAALAIHLVIVAVAAIGTPTPAPDFDRYYQIATGQGRPYIDYQVEHPIGTLLLFKTLAGLSGSRTRFALAIVGVNAIADAAIVAALFWGWGLVAALSFAVLVLPILDLLLNRIDLWSTACAAVAVTAWRRDRPYVMVVAAALGGAFKLWPLAFLTLAVVGRRRHPIGPLVLGTLVLATTGLVWLGVAGWRGLYEVVTFRGATGWQIESVVGSILHAAGSPSMRLESGSWRIGTSRGAVSILMFLIAAPVYVWSIWQGARRDRIGAGWLAGVSALLACSALLSAQFAGWLVPGAAIAWAEGDRRLARWAAAAVLLTGIFWKWYWAVLQHFTPILLLVVARNVVLIVLAVTAVRSLAAPSAIEPDLKADLPRVAVVERPERG